MPESGRGFGTRLARLPVLRQLLRVVTGALALLLFGACIVGGVLMLPGFLVYRIVQRLVRGRRRPSADAAAAPEADPRP